MPRLKNKVTGALLFFLGQEVGHREVALASIVVENENPGILTHFGQLLPDCCERRARRNSHQQALFDWVVRAAQSG